MTTNTCTRCNRPTETFLCWPCTRALADVLNQIPWLSNKLLVTAHGGSALNKLDERQFFEKSGPIAEDEMQSPVPFNTTATKRLRDIRTVLTWWVRDICDTEDLEFEILGASRVYGPLPEGVRRIPANYGATTTDLARWLAHHFTLFMGREDAATACEEIHGAFDRGIEAINRRDQGIYVGPCPTITGVAADGKTPTRCREALYARRDANDGPQPHVTCWKCRQRHDVALLRDRIWAQAENFLLTGAEILRVMGELGERIPKNRFYQWRKDRLIQPRGWKAGDRITQRVTPGAKPVFSLAEVRELAAREGVTA
ncbi:helix-turn-helix DNA binding domain protein [Gordonia phage Gudmit]|nr:helix-turn-helix DNA binding domain protein [Gordonia phage Gudmit]